MTQLDLEDVFESFNQRNVLIIGDVMIDSYLWGDVSRISPEAPVPVLSKTQREMRLGGAANVALNVQSLGANPILCSVIGEDLYQQEFLNLLEAKKLSVEGIVCDKDRVTTIKTRIISQNHHLLRVDDEDDQPISFDLQEKLVQKVKTIVDGGTIDAIIFEDYDKGVIVPEVIDRVVGIAKEKEIPTLVDPKKRNFNAYQGVTLFKPNFKEFKEGNKIDLIKGNQESLLEAGCSFRDENGVDILMITLSEYGVFVCENGSHHFIPAEIRNIADVSGAGDTVISVSALCLASGLDACRVAQIGNLAGGLVCEKSGVVPIDKSLLLSECLEKIK